MSTFEFNHFENAVFCALSLFYDCLTVSMDELPLIDIMEDFNKLENIFCEVSEDKNDRKTGQRGKNTYNTL